MSRFVKCVALRQGIVTYMYFTLFDCHLLLAVYSKDMIFLVMLEYFQKNYIIC